MPEPRVITIIPRDLRTLERAALRIDGRKFPRHAEVLSIAIAQRRVAERKRELRRAA